MGWRKLKPARPSEWTEKPLQAIFNEWGSAVRTAGAPKWLEDVKSPAARAAVPAYGYSFTPDALWTTAEGTYVVELKYSYKYQPLALAEVLHHAFMLEGRDGFDQRITPVVITSYDPWLRAAARWMRHHAAGKPNLVTLEVDVLEGGGMLWFDDPQAEWQAATAPAFLPRDYKTDWHWYRIEETRTWCATRSASASRPLFVGEPYVMVSKIWSPAGESEDFILKQDSTPPEPHARSSPGTGETSEFYLASPVERGSEPTPPRSRDQPPVRQPPSGRLRRR